MRTTFGEVRTSRIPQSLGLCASDTGRLQSFVNAAQKRLMLAGGDRGWWGTWYQIALTATNGYVTLPRAVARLIDVAVCQEPIRIRNEWYEFLYAGWGLQPPSACTGCPDVCGNTQALDRRIVCTAADLVPGNFIRAYSDDPDGRDAGKNLLIQATDTNGKKIRSNSGTNVVEGFYLTLSAPFVTSGFGLNSIYGVMKDQTYGNITLYQVDAVTGAESLLAAYEPSEYRPNYRRYYLDNLPENCCSSSCALTITGMAKLDLIPVELDTDWLLIGNIEALKEGCMGIKYGEQDSQVSQALAKAHLKTAISLLNQELDHYIGRENPAVNFKPFGKAQLRKSYVGSLV